LPDVITLSFSSACACLNGQSLSIPRVPGSTTTWGSYTDGTGNHVTFSLCGLTWSINVICSPGTTNAMILQMHSPAFVTGTCAYTPAGNTTFTCSPLNVTWSGSFSSPSFPPTLCSICSGQSFTATATA